MNSDIELKSNRYEMLKCIWMTSGVIDYKLCDNNFDCENCPFDKVIRNLSDNNEKNMGGIVNAVNAIFNKLQSIKDEPNIIYLNNNLIAKEICANTFYLGINPIWESFLDNVNSMIVCECRKNISAGQPVIQINGDWGSVSITSPINFIIYNEVGEPADNPLKSQWFAIMGANQSEVFNSRLNQEQWNNIHAKAIRAIEEIKTKVPVVGETMMDGGTQIKFLHQLIGRKRYTDILSSLNF